MTLDLTLQEINPKKSIEMKKVFVFMAVLAGIVLFTSCENMFDNIH